eukprot:scaffold317330_cov32-Tisochrysis_lutea.AAC.2
MDDCVPLMCHSSSIHLVGGFFGFGGGKSMDEGKRKQIANKAYQNGVDAINKYITLGNDGLGLNFTPLDTID